ncbi:MAG: sugar phosphate nucleotidyltransferase [Bacilli bacterium]
MKLVLLSGGSGKRLWPMSNDIRSKQFLRVLPTEGGEPMSMLQRVWTQIGEADLQEDAYICSSRAQLDVIEAQIGRAAFIEEPARRDTFPAISLACAYLWDVEKVPEDDMVVIMPIDPYVDSEFFAGLKMLPQVLGESGADMVLMGVRPTEPSGKFGYIRVEPGFQGGGGASGWKRVASFVEKPARDAAERLVAEGALWNCGVFCFRLGYMKGVLNERGLPFSYGELSGAFPSLPKRSFDYEVVEKASSIAVHPFSGLWTDLGTWGSLSQRMTDRFIGKGGQFRCEDTHVINELGIPLLTIGLRDAIVVATPDGMLVADKEMSTQVKEFVAPFEGRPMFEERRWGLYRVMDYQELSDGTEVLTRWIELLPGHNLSYHKHERRAEMWTVLEGSGEVAVDGRLVQVTAGDVVRIHPEQWHAIRARDKLAFIEVQRGSEIVEHDIIRRYHTWAEIVDYLAVTGGLRSVDAAASMKAGSVPSA